VFCFCFISHVTTSEIKLKQNCFVSVLFQFYFRCNHCLMMVAFLGTFILRRSVQLPEQISTCIPVYLAKY